MDNKKIIRAVIVAIAVVLVIVGISLISKDSSGQKDTKDKEATPVLADGQTDTSEENSADDIEEETTKQAQETETTPVSETESQEETSETAEEETEEQDDIDNLKKVYLTFDDGPSENTPKVLDILKEYDVKATFFVIGRTDDLSLEMYKRIVDEGHSIGVHSYTHNYDEIYASLDNFKEDYYKLHDLIYDTTGYKTDIYRFPGGSANKFTPLPISTFIEFLAENDIVYYDWNVINGDYYSQGVSANEAYDLVMEGVNMYNNSFVLMHDSKGKETTVESLPGIIESLLEKDCAILPLTSDVKPAQQVSVDDVIG